MRVLLLLLLLVRCAPPDDELRVLAAASLSEALTEIAGHYETDSGEQVVLQFGGSSTLARQIEQGAPADVFLSADQQSVDRLAGRGLVDSQVALLSNTLVVVVADGRRKPPANAAELQGFTSIALGEPATVPAGIYAREWLARIGLWESLAPKVIPVENVRAALAAVERGNADAAVVYATDVRAARGVRVAFAVGGPHAPDITYPAVVLRSSRADAGQQFVSWLHNARAREVFRRHGFVVRKP